MLSDTRFLSPEPVADEPRPDFKRALAGIGDPMRREAEDFFMGFTGVPLADAAGSEPFAVGDTVEYVTPDGVRRCGQLLRPHSESEWLVRVDAGEQHIVPQVELQPSEQTPRHVHRAAVQAAMQRASTWQLRRQPEPQRDGTVLLTVDVGHSKVSDLDVQAFAAEHGYDAVDVAREHTLLRITAQTHIPEEAPSEPDRGAHPGLHTEEIEGTGRIGEQLERQGYKLGAFIDDGDVLTIPWTMPRRYLEPSGRVTATLTERGAPLSGHFELRPATGELKRFVYTAEGTIEAPYASGTGPESVRENAPSGFEDGDYVVRAADEYAQAYFRDYYGDFGDMLVRDFEDGAKRKPTPDEAKRVQAVLQTRGALLKSAQMVQAKDIVNTLIDAGAKDERLRAQLDRVVVNAIGKNPAQLLNQVDQTIYPRILYGALQGDQGRKLLRLYRLFAPKSGDAGGPDFGSPELFNPPATPSAADARAYLEQNSPEFARMAPPYQEQMIQQLLADPPDDLKPKAPEGAQVVLPQSRRTPQQAPAQPQAPAAPPREGPAWPRGQGGAPASQSGVAPTVPSVDQDTLIPRTRQQLPRTDRPPPLPRRANRQPAFGDTVRPQLDSVTARGQYLHVTMTWDPEHTEGMSDGNIQHHLTTWLKGIATLKEQYPDLGTLGKPRFEVFDPDVGLAEVLVRSSEGRSFPQEVVHAGTTSK